MNVERIATVVVVVYFGIFGLALFLFPAQVATEFGLEGTDEFAYRSGGAAYLGYATALAFTWTELPTRSRILWLATVVAAASMILAGVLSIAFGQAHTFVPLSAVLGGAAATFSAAGLALRTAEPAVPRPTGRRFATWFVYFLGWGVLASALFGIGGLVLGSTFGTLAGFPGGDDPIYRLAGAATIGILVGSILALRTQDWEQVRLPVILSFVTNVLTLIGGIVYISHGGVPPTAYLIAGAAVFNIAGLGLALSGRR